MQYEPGYDDKPSCPYYRQVKEGGHCCLEKDESDARSQEIP